MASLNMVRDLSGAERPAVIIGGGPTGTIMAAQLAAHSKLPIVLVERSPSRHGCGVAFGTRHPRHILNVRAAGMSAFPEAPDHFARWLAARGDAGPHDFVERGLYGDYLCDVLADARRQAGGRLATLAGNATGVERQPEGLVVRLADGPPVPARAVILAPGNLPPAVPAWLDLAALPAGAYIDDPWTDDLAHRLPADGTVVVLGTGLTAVDVALRLDAGGFRGRIICLSRRGLRPHRHLDGVFPQQGRSVAPAPRLSILVRELRDRATAIGWHAAVDEMRPVTQALWAQASVATRARFLRHLRPYWDIHRHRLAPVVADRFDAMVRAGRVQIVAGRIRSTEAMGDRISLSWISRATGEMHREDAVAIVNCTGPQTDVRRTGDVLLDALLGRGMIRPDPLALGIDVDSTSRVIDAKGHAQNDLLCIGPMSRGTFWEIVAVPDIRWQCHQLARRVASVALADAQTAVYRVPSKLGVVPA